MSPIDTLTMSASVISLSGQTVAKKLYVNKHTGGTFSFSAGMVFFALIIFLLTSKGTFRFSSSVLTYSFWFALSYGLAVVGSFLAIKTGPISLTSLFNQNSLLVPVFYGILFQGEALTSKLIFGIVLLIVSLIFINYEKGAKQKNITLGWVIFIIISFIGNGVCSTVQRVQAINFNGEYKNEFMIIAYGITLAAIFIIAVFTEKKDILSNLKNGLAYFSVGGLCNGVLNYLSLIMALTIPAAIMFPVRSAAGVILNTLISVFCFKEKLSAFQLIGIAIGTASIVVLNM
ncbi:MAG: DMT family transporter [Clostridia bacterium]|nr:DMT family transporter [Clostridia bacterium]